MMGDKYKGEVEFHIISWLRTEHDFRKLFDDIKAQLTQRFNAYNKYVESVYKLTWDSDMQILYKP